MKIKNRKTRILLLGGLLSALLIAGVIIASCGSEYEKPTATETPTALIDAATLKAWMDADMVNAASYNRVVILDVTSQATYDAGHIPGAHYLNSSDIAQTRNEGVAASSTEVPEGAKMDAIIQKYGIDSNTTIVITGTGTPHNICRTYFTFRYWGFPKSRLKVLNGGNNGWTAASNLLTTLVPPAPAPSSYSVWNNRVLRDDLRLSLAEMIAYADGNPPNVVAIDGRGATGSYAGTAGSTTGAFSPATDYPVFEGRIRGAQAAAYTSLYNSSTFQFLSEAQIIAVFTPTGLDSTKTAYIYCRVGMLGAISFFAIDGILGWPAALYDGSWMQWGQLSGNTSMKGQLDPSSPWRTDTAGRSDVITYNWDSNGDATPDRAVEQYTLDGSGCSAMYNTAGTVTNSWGGTTACTNLPISDDTDANRIETEDRLYMSTPPSGGSGGSSGGGGSTIPSGC